jgi:hypothetical protein
MQKSTILIGVLLLTNAFAGVMWWRSQQQSQYWMNESRTLSKQHEIASRENGSLQEAMIIGDRVSSLKLYALNNTELGKCVSEHLNNAQDYCGGPERVIKGYQKILNSPTDSKKLGSIVSQLLELHGTSHEKKMVEICGRTKVPESNSQCVLYRNLQKANP